MSEKYILERINMCFRDLGRPYHNELLGKDSYQYFQTPISFFSTALELIRLREGSMKDKKFIDLGSGLGFICALAAKEGLKVDGIEINPIYIEWSQKFFPEIKIYNMNIWDFNNYQDYDIVFYYLPFFKPEFIESFRIRIENSVKIGTYIITTEEEKQNLRKDDRFLPIETETIRCKIWKKIKES